MPTGAAHRIWSYVTAGGVSEVLTAFETLAESVHTGAERGHGANGARERRQMPVLSV